MNKSYDTPDDEEVLQIDYDDIDDAIAVKVENVVKVDEVPCRSGGTGKRTAPITGVKLFNRDERRKCATIISLDQDFYLGNKIGDVQNGSGACQWPALTPLLITSSDEWYAAGVSGDANISFIIEQWAR